MVTPDRHLLLRGGDWGRRANPIRAWLARVAAECGSPEAMLLAAPTINDKNARRMVEAEARLWLQERNRVATQA